MILDTSVLSGIVSKDITRRTTTAKFLGASTGLKTSVIVAYEIEFGLIRKNATQSLDAFRELCTQSFDLVEVTPAIARLAAKARASQEAKGRIFHTEDLLIGATAVILGVPIVTFNIRDFEHWDIEIISPNF